MPMAMFMKENGKTIRPMERESIHMLMDPDMKASGLKINSTDLVLKGGLMVLHMKDNMLKARNMAKVNSLGLMPVLLLEISLTTISMVMEFMNGQMAESTLVIGRTTRWKDTAPSHGLMAENT